MSKSKFVALYHITPVQNIPWILEGGLVPQIGPIAKRQGVTQSSVPCYTSARAAMSAADNDGKFRVLAVQEYGEDVELYILRILMKPEEAVAASEVDDEDSVLLMCKVPADSLVVMNDSLDYVILDALEEIKSKYGPENCEPPATFPKPSADLPF